MSHSYMYMQYLRQNSVDVQFAFMAHLFVPQIVSHAQG